MKVATSKKEIIAVLPIIKAEHKIMMYMCVRVCVV